MPTRGDVYRLLAKGMEAAQAGQQAQAHNLLLDVVQLDGRNELAWLWLSRVADDLDDQRICLENVLTINPNNGQARERLAALDSARPPADRSARQSPSAAANASATSRPIASVTLWPVVAFWTGVSLSFIGGGVASLFQFAGILLHTRGGLQNLSPIQTTWLAVAAFFIIFGLTGLSLAWQLGRRRPGGYYGSLLLGLVLILLGPGFGLILEPPNYLAAACTGLAPAAAVLFTLASMTGFESTHDSSLA